MQGNLNGLCLIGLNRHPPETLQLSVGAGHLGLHVFSIELNHCMACAVADVGHVHTHGDGTVLGQLRSAGLQV